MTRAEGHGSSTTATRHAVWMASAAVVLACAVGGCYTQLASVQPATDVTDGGDGEEVFPAESGDAYWRPPNSYYPDAGRYPEDRYDDPIYGGWSYFGSGSSGSTSGYDAYYGNRWWLNPRYNPPGGGGYGSVPADTARVSRTPGRQMWRAPGTPQPGGLPASSGGSAVVSGGNTSGTGPPAAPPDTTQSKDKKRGSGRKLWR